MLAQTQTNIVVWRNRINPKAQAAATYSDELHQTTITTHTCLHSSYEDGQSGREDMCLLWVFVKSCFLGGYNCFWDRMQTLCIMLHSWGFVDQTEAKWTKWCLYKHCSDFQKPAVALQKTTITTEQRYHGSSSSYYRPPQHSSERPSVMVEGRDLSI